MASSTTLTPHDLTILQKIADPESSPSASLLIVSSLPKDPDYPDPSIYSRITSTERQIISQIQINDALDAYRTALSQLNDLITAYPNYASARNNRAQVLRRIHGDTILIKTASQTSSSEAELNTAAQTILSDLTLAISLLSPLTPYSPLSPIAAKTLAQAYTQRGALFHLTAKQYSQQGTELRIEGKEKGWSVVEFEEAASRDFVMGGRLGNVVAREMAVLANPTAKLCGEIVRGAMREEYVGGVS
ncbi:uncharacterized protein LY89DRAFT_658263 [Mollisia scopiformis]|uniref:Uncharacterized protein n=1 Tax=Mollisia scopiformis TaxID=149040 RepID=A0A132B9U1_MOLSC|nr:uncharacterized protein LY89DRAFT_658263 [Mollisia scopiformis]KUJ09176.1 hypothetical protein LY89DRAFT_658263 [Mollisia scopiformis]